MASPKRPSPSSKASPPAVLLISLGCAKNTVDSETALGGLLSAGFVLALEPEDADLVIVNTCAFIESARDEAREHLREVLGWKRERPGLRIAVMGCFAQKDGETLRKEFPELDGVFGFEAYPKMVDHCRRLLGGEAVDLCGGEALSPISGGPRLLITGGVHAFLRLAEGCNNRCTYCSVPDIRGPYRSRPAEDVLAEAKELLDLGVRELCLVAQDTTLWGHDLPGERALASLLTRLLDVPGEPWLRLLYAHPAHLDDEVIDLLASEPRLLGYLDLPIQHINDDVLQRMGRRVGRSEVEGLVEKLRARVPNLVLRTSIITGFPGEDDGAFEELVEFVDKGHFQQLGAFAYSREEGTPAAAWADQVPTEVARQRAETVMEHQQAVAFAWLDSRLGQQESVLIESSDDEGLSWGRSRSEAPDIDGIVEVQGIFSPGETIEACLVSRDGYDLIARPK